MRPHCKEVSARRILPAKAEGVVLPCWAELKQIHAEWVFKNFHYQGWSWGDWYGDGNWK